MKDFFVCLALLQINFFSAQASVQEISLIRAEPLRVLQKEVLEFFEKKDSKTNQPNLTGFGNLSGLISKQFSHFLNSYAKAYNKEQNRKGGLFMTPFKRKKIITEEYLRKVIHYIHHNPIEANLCKRPENWKYSSYNHLLSDTST